MCGIVQLESNLRLTIVVTIMVLTPYHYAIHCTYMHILSGGNVPYDGSPVEAVDHTHVALTVIYVLLGILGLVFAVACLIFNTLFKNKR